MYLEATHLFLIIILKVAFNFNLPQLPVSAMSPVCHVFQVACLVEVNVNGHMHQ